MRKRLVKGDQQAKQNLDRRPGARLTIGLILDLLGHEYQSKVRAGVADLVNELDANLICFAGGVLRFPAEHGSQRNAIYGLVNQANVDGLVILGSVAHFISPEERKD